MPAPIDAPQGTKVMSIAHCYITSYPYQSMAEAKLRFVWMKHEIDENGVNLSPQNECTGAMDFSAPFGAIAAMEITPLDGDGEPVAGLPVLPIAAIAAYVKGAGYQLLAHKQASTGPFAGEAPPEPEE